MFSVLQPSPPGRGPLIPTNPPPVLAGIPYPPRSQIPVYIPQPNQMPLPNQRPPGHYIPPNQFTQMHPQAPIYQPMHPIGQNPTQIISSTPFGGSKGSSSVNFHPPQPTQTYHSQSQPKRSSKAIKIIDPSTREEVSMEGKTSTETNSSSSIITQPPPATVPKNDVAALFQSKVQGALNPDTISSSEPAPKPNAIVSSPLIVAGSQGRTGVDGIDGLVPTSTNHDKSPSMQRKLTPDTSVVCLSLNRMDYTNGRKVSSDSLLLF